MNGPGFALCHIRHPSLSPFGPTPFFTVTVFPQRLQVAFSLTLFLMIELDSLSEIEIRKRSVVLLGSYVIGPGGFLRRIEYP